MLNRGILFFNEPICLTNFISVGLIVVGVVGLDLSSGSYPLRRGIIVFSFTNKVALVTGGNAGIGQAAALKFAESGAQVIVAARRRSEGNAGILGASSNVHEYTEESWDEVMDINLKGVWLCMKYEIEQMLKQGGGVIVNNASVAGVLGGAGITGYRVSKAGVIMLTKAAALDYAEQNIRVNAVCPGYIRTPGLERIMNNSADREAGMVASEPMGRMGTPEEVAETVAWLCSDTASFVTGHIMALDGGMLARG
ncbi:SDR family oxidoreductase [Chloroflexi bacterium TSY]|nr:SDR family oxidoreductase [Chloroflexi bacterium TSY]